MGGDKVENSQDSRYRGVLPDNLIVGRIPVCGNQKILFLKKSGGTEYQRNWNDSANRIETELRRVFFWPIRFYAFHLHVYKKTIRWDKFIFSQ